MKIITPQTKDDFEKYYHLRWRILRKPWGQAEGTERDNQDGDCYHIMAVNDDVLMGVARLEFPHKDTAQLRYMAVDTDAQNKGVGRLIVKYMEQQAKKNNACEMMLNARENAVGFYEKLGYVITEKSYLLFDSIQHYKMTKTLK